MPLAGFHPAVARWFEGRFAGPTEPQHRAWPLIQAGGDVLIAAPTGAGKTFAAFLSAIDGLLREGLAGGLPDETQVVYVSPLKALSNDIQKNLAEPLAEIRASLPGLDLPDVELRTLVRTGDTPAAARQAMLQHPPHILVTTPESLYLILTSPRARAMLRNVRTVIVDEIHAVARDKRGSHLALTLERLAALTGRRPQRIGLSATQRPIEEIAQFLVGTGRPQPAIVDAGHYRALDVAIEIPDSPLEAVMAAEVWDEVTDRVARLVEEHRSTLVFVNTRRLCERLTLHLSERLGSDRVTSHHGSLSKEKRLDAEERLKRGDLKALVATASLELGIDIGAVDLAIQIGSTRAIATFLQRVGRSGHRLDATPRGRLFPLSRDELIECAALLRATRAGRLDRLIIPEQPLDILAQQIVAAAACEEWDDDALYAHVPAGVSLPRPDARRLRRRRAHARRRLHHEARTPRCAPALRRRQPPPQGAARRPPRRHHVGRRDPRPRRLSRRARAHRDARRQRERGLRDRVHARRHLPAGQHLVRHHPHRDAAGRGARGRRAGPAPHHPVLVRRGAGTHRRAVGGSVAPAARRRGPAGAPRRGGRLARGRDPGSARARRPADRRVPRGDAEGPGRGPQPRDARARAVFRRGRRHAARGARAVREPDQPRLGARAAQAVLPQLQLRAPGGGHRGRDRAVPRRAAQLRAGRRVPLPAPGPGRAPAGAGDARRPDVHEPLALEREPGAGDPAASGRAEGPDPDPADGSRGPASPPSSPTSSPVPRTWPATARSPTTRS